MNPQDDPLSRALAWAESGTAPALATVVKTWGSSPRQPGSTMAIAPDGAFEGSVSGGCIEGAVIAEAMDALEAGRPRVAEFGATDEMAWQVGLACGGQVRVLIAPAPDAKSLRRLVRAKPAALVTEVASGRFAVVERDAAAGPLALDAAQLAKVRRLIAADRSAYVDEGETIFAAVANPPLRLIVVGAVHIAQSLVPIAREAGFGVAVVDPRGAFATETRFPGVAKSHAWPDEALEEIGLDSRTAVVVLSHDPKIDDPALIAALRSEAFYVGALGSKKNHERRLGRLAEAGVDKAQLARIHGPVGLDLGGKSPAEIALAIVAQTVQVKNRGPA